MSLLFLVSVLTLSFIYTANAVGPVLRRNSLATKHIQSLIPASQAHGLRRRADDFSLYHSANIDYIQENGHLSTVKPFVSTVRLQSSGPMLILEEFEHLLDDISCFQHAPAEHFAVLRFYSKAVCGSAKEAWSQLSGALLLTSHTGCNQEEERAIYRIRELEHTASQELRFRLEPETWHGGMKSLTVDFGSSFHGGHIPRSQLLRRRQEPKLATTTVMSTVAETVTVVQFQQVTQQDFPTSSASPSLNITTIPIPPPASATPWPSGRPFEMRLDYQKTNQSISIPTLPDIAFGCENCTTSGSLDVLIGSFDIDFANAAGPGDFITNGTVQIAMPGGFQAHIELGLNVTVTLDFEIPIIDIPIQGFSIGGIGTAGLYFSPQVALGLELDAPVELGFGFEVDIPENSTLTLDVNQVSNFTSSIQGFNETTAKALPATLNASLTGALTASFQPNIIFGFELASPAPKSPLVQAPQLGAHVAAIFDAPQLTFNLSKQEAAPNATLQCEREDGSNLFDLISSEILFGMGVEAELYVQGIPDTGSTAGSGNSSSNGKAEDKEEKSPDLFGIPLPSTSFNMVKTTIQAASTCVGKARPGEIKATAAAELAPVIVTTVLPPPPSSTSFPLPTEPPAPVAKAPGKNDATVVGSSASALVVALLASVLSAAA